MTDKRFPNEHLLASPEWLQAHLDDPGVRVVEVTPPGAGYVLGHIRGAVFLNRATLLIGAATPITGPKPFDVEATVQFNLRF